jgi:hypothetical protein
MISTFKLIPNQNESQTEIYKRRIKVIKMVNIIKQIKRCFRHSINVIEMLSKLKKKTLNRTDVNRNTIHH